ncbi:MAG: ATP synthase subunit I [Christensenellales bacterium]|nr:ATP synthase subunit I [Christensenellales bacterium]
MEGRKIVFRETLTIVIGVALLTAVMLGIFALAGYFSAKVLLGGVVGFLLAICNFFIMAVGASLAADKAAGQDVKGGMAIIRLSYIGRLALIFIILFACVRSGRCNVLASLMPLVFIRPVVTFSEFFKKREGQSK